MTIKHVRSHPHRDHVISMFLVGFIGAMVLGVATLGIMDYYTFSAIGEHLHFDIPIISSNTFLNLGTFMLASLIGVVLLIVGIMVLATSLNPKPDLAGWTRPEHLIETSLQTESINNTPAPLSQQQPTPQLTPNLVICRYCDREITHGKYCSECHLTSGYVLSRYEEVRAWSRSYRDIP